MNARTRFVTAIIGCTMLSGTAFAQNYQHGYQQKHGRDAQFFVDGPATGANPDFEGDAMLERVVMPTGDTFHFFYKPAEVLDIQWFANDAYRSNWFVRGGSRTTVGPQGIHRFGDYDGNMGDVTQQDIDGFAKLTYEAFNNNNLNNYLDTNSNGARWLFTVRFDMIVKDDDPGPDEFGEILYFERGKGDGNSWLKMQAVDAAGTPLGPWLVIGPNETLQTTPQTTVMRSDQKMGTTSIDVSRLGVSEFEYLRISNRVLQHPAYTGGGSGDISPDFKVMAVMTNQEQLAEVMGFFD